MLFWALIYFEEVVSYISIAIAVDNNENNPWKIVEFFDYLLIQIASSLLILLKSEDNVCSIYPNLHVN